MLARCSNADMRMTVPQDFLRKVHNHNTATAYSPTSIEDMKGAPLRNIDHQRRD